MNISDIVKYHSVFIVQLSLRHRCRPGISALESSSDFRKASALTNHTDGKVQNTSAHRHHRLELSNALEDRFGSCGSVPAGSEHCSEIT
jgi:hypothetical protein